MRGFPFACRRSILAAILAAVLATASKADIAEDASEYVADEADRLFEIMALPSGPDRRSEFGVWLASAFDLDHLAERALGRYLAKAAQDELASYTEAFRNYIVATYEKRLDFISGYEFAVRRSRSLTENDAVVRTRVTAPEGGEHVIDFRIGMDEDHRLRVLDIAIEGLSMLKTQRDEFAAVIRRSGIDGLTELLMVQVARESE